jgi:ABC-type branched-subunit amino acid transport system substrate-binding protein
MRAVRGARAVAGSVAVALAALLAATGCTHLGVDGSDPLGDSSDLIRLYGTDGNMLNGVGEGLTDYPDGLAGMKGTAPLTRLPRTFRERLRTIDSNLKDDLYAGESYDAVVISSLAAQIARTTDPRSIAAQIGGVTNSGTVCHSPGECLLLIASGTDIVYRGISLQLGGFTDAGEPSAATYGILHFAGRNQLDDEQTEFVPAGDPNGASTKTPPRPAGNGGGAPLKIGGLLSHTGVLAPGGPAMFAGARLAVRDINEHGGILGRPVQWIDGDDHTDKVLAVQTAQQEIAEGVQVIIGAGASSITGAVLPVTVKAGVILFSPCNTAAALTTADDQGLYFRTAPPDGLQAKALTDIIMRDGVRRIVIVARDDSYGKGLMNSVRTDLISAGLDSADVKTMPYDSDKPDFTHVGRDVKDFAPDGVLVIGFDESTGALDSIMKVGLRSRIV